MKRLLSILAIATVVVACNNETNIPVNGMGNASFKIVTSGTMSSDKEARSLNLTVVCLKIWQ